MSTSQCSAISSAMNAKGYSSAQLAAQLGMSAQHINDILSGRVKATPQEFDSIAAALGLSNAPAHAAKVTA